MKKIFSVLVYLIAFNASAQFSAVKVNSKVYSDTQTVQVKLPSSYTSNNTRNYPILYVLHGQWDSAYIDATLDAMASNVPEFIVVAIPSKGAQLHPITSNSSNPPASLFRQYLSQELIPYVHKHYRSAKYSVLVGHSNAGKFALEQFLKGNTQFTDYFAFSPSMDDGYLVELAAKGKALSGSLFMSVADEGEHMQAPFEKLATHFTQQKHLNFSAKQYPGYGHQDSKLIAFVDALKFRYNKWQPSYEEKVAGFDSYFNHYKHLEKTYGFQVLPQKDDVLRLIAYFAVHEKPSEVKLFTDYLQKHFDDAEQSIVELREYLLAEGYDGAVKLLI
ncbi:hypothetical protein HG263_20425 [Pseudoalteromonas sp. JBTF-M23]|uniref:Esterase n=1 Tax=Pseudoalteromonas caenipelagi TaxID=2726988 RepID=A0A849VMC1_9GAMM|nr:alpha/beta hydrolase-fold protein [Pseudoalteromonas caenipelagi]NOU52874.1 hypothetical protein [Pseudoalteromonas caenipelagi]